MPEQPQQETLTAADIRRLLTQKYPPETEREQVYVSVVLALLESTEGLEEELKKQSRLVQGLGVALGKVAAALNLDLRALLTGKASEAGAGGGGEGGAGAAAPSGPTDQTPFPAGVATSAPPGTTQRVTVQPAAEEEIPAPNAQSGPAVNARPNLKPNPNGAKAS